MPQDELALTSFRGTLVYALETDAGTVTIFCQKGKTTVQEGVAPGAPVLNWPSSALAQLVTGYRSADMLGALCGSKVPPQVLALLQALFSQRWRFSRNESWTFRG